MTVDEIEAAWTRFMHRNDMEADFPTVWIMANNMIENNLMYTPIDLDGLLADEPQLFLHGGLLYLAEIAQDDQQLQRENAKFGGAIGAYQMKRSIQTPARMTRETI